MKFLILFPALIYVLSYICLSYYHGKCFIFNTLVHENGKYTLFQDMFYASHFLGHVPICTVVALFFVGTYLCLTPSDWVAVRKGSRLKIITLLVIVLGASFLIGLIVFGVNDTVDFIVQKKQGVGIYQQGGAWNLHLPSTMMLFLLIPSYLYILKRVLNKPVELNSAGVFLLAWRLLSFFDDISFEQRHIGSFL